MLDGHENGRRLSLTQLIEVMLLANQLDLIGLAAQANHHVTDDVGVASQLHRRA